jgi:iron complex transport system ATP-binding protein
MTQPILSVSDLSFSYTPDRPAAVNQVGFEILPGTVTAILGPNGAGKTTLLHLLLGLEHARTGNILLDKRSLHMYSRRSLSQWIGLVPQSENIHFEFTVLEYLLLGRAPYLGPMDQPGENDVVIARRSMAMVGIDHLTDRSVLTLSGGEQQLVTLARALTQEPRILLLDEPTSHLDINNRNATLHILDQLRSSGKTIIFTTHDPEAAALIADHLVLMRSGEVMESGLMENTFTSEKLSRTYGMPVEVMRIDGLWVVKSMERLSWHSQEN